MNEVDLKKRAEELEQTLNLQLKQLRKDSQVWLIGGGVALFVGFLSYRALKKKNKKKNSKNLNADTGSQESSLGNRNKKKRSSRTSSFFPSLKKRLFLTLLSYGQTKLVKELNKRKKNWNEK